MTRRLFRSLSAAAPSSMPQVVITRSPSLGVHKEEEEDDDYDQSSNSDADSHRRLKGHHNQKFSVMGVVASALKRSLVTCSVDRDEVASEVDIGWPTNIRHVSHVTFDRFSGFIGLPEDLQPHVPPVPPSASASVFGVSAQSMQCSHDHRGNSVPKILLRMQDRLYSEGGLQAEGIFRINAENSQEEDVRKQLNKGVVPRGIDVHCLAGLIKAWFRELPKGVLDSLSPEQVMHCNTEQECTQLVKQLSPPEAALLDWAINLMADVVQHEHQNKMNARNIAMVFAPNMTQMADPLTALIHAVQVMNFLKTLIEKNLREREGSYDTDQSSFPSFADFDGRANPVQVQPSGESVHEQEHDNCISRSASTLEGIGYDNTEGFRSRSDLGDEYYKSFSDGFSSSSMRKRRTLENSFRDEEYDDGNEEEVEGVLNRLSLRRGVRKLCRHPVFQLSKPVKKSGIETNGRGDKAVDARQVQFRFL